ncbi:hypothetical protein QVD17_31160 [Tagetes erecta]|uniref:Uncharacterized protein n=1 Tax=Tagetes erecta TaxID=13708 RepID=A0AAD8K423_TARER|nr:hypothetical protein QVD17_31160 [Tagetes erecta]
MPPSLRFVTSNLVTRSMVRLCSTHATSSRFRSIIASYSTMPKHGSFLQVSIHIYLFDHSWPRSMSPEISSVSFEATMAAKERGLKLYTPKCEEGDYYDGVTVELFMPALDIKEMRACAEHNNLTCALNAVGLTMICFLIDRF